MPTLQELGEPGVINDEVREQLIKEYLKTPAKRQMLIQSTIIPGRDLALRVREAHEKSPFRPIPPKLDAGLASVVKMLANMERIVTALQQHGEYIPPEFGYVYDDLERLRRDIERTPERPPPPPTPETSWARLMKDDSE
jgi:hypothetical protein